LSIPLQAVSLQLLKDVILATGIIL